MKDIVKEIDINQLNLNAQTIRLLLPHNTRFCAVVKSNAYGHGIKQVSKVIEKYVDYFAVINNKEAITLRKITDKPILVLGSFNSLYLKKAIENKIEQSVAHPSHLNQLIKICNKNKLTAKIHIQINSGLQRLGVSNKEELNSLIKLSKSCKWIEIESVYSHLSNRNEIQITKQLDTFRNLTKGIKAQKHLFNSAFYKTEKPLDMVRVGIGLYGYNFPYVEPILTIKARIVEIRKVKKGEQIGYGENHIAKVDMLVAVIAIGYRDGLPYTWGKNGYVLFSDKKCPFVADICMNMSIIKATEEMKINDYVTIIGKCDKKSILASEIAKSCHTIVDEVLTNFTHISC